MSCSIRSNNDIHNFRSDGFNWIRDEVMNTLQSEDLDVVVPTASSIWSGDMPSIRLDAFDSIKSDEVMNTLQSEDLNDILKSNEVMNTLRCEDFNAILNETAGDELFTNNTMLR